MVTKGLWANCWYIVSQPLKDEFFSFDIIVYEDGVNGSLREVLLPRSLLQSCNIIMGIFGFKLEQGEMILLGEAESKEDF